MAYAQISADECRKLIEEKEITIIDIRDPDSYKAGHIENAVHVDDSNVEQFVDSTDKSKPIVVCCYHGNSSQGAAEYMNENGFAESYSLVGGYAAWNGS